MTQLVTIARALSSIPSLLFIVLILQAIQFKLSQAIYVPATINQSALRIHDPIVWSENSLYESPGRVRQSDQRFKRSTNTNTNNNSNNNSNSQQQQQTHLVDACQSKMEILTPYYATNSKGKLRTIVNSELMQQAIQVETCLRSPAGQSAARCNAQPDCGCEQKYKWHRLLVLDSNGGPNAAARGLFMDWFLFPSNCVCRCKTSSTRQFLQMVKKRSD